MSGATTATIIAIAREAVHNAYHHAGATNIVVTLRSSPQDARLTITDDGRGMSVGSVDSLMALGPPKRARRVPKRRSVPQ